MRKGYFFKTVSFGLALSLVCSLFPVQPLRAQEAVNSPKKAAEAQRMEKENVRKDTKPDAAQMKDTKADASQMKDTKPDAAQMKDTKPDAAQIKDTKADASQIEDTELYTSQMEEIKIYTAEDFLDFASQCYVDSWSLNKYITLQSDISLLGVEFEMIPVFAGVFDGCNHTISGFDYTGDGYVAGLFRYIEKEGVVKNLKLRGNITAANEKECIGSICGVNYGTIKNCSFQGNVSGRESVGGIVGTNESSGTVTGCSTSGRITGYYTTGGIAGKNHGVLTYCTNRAGINDDSDWVEEDDEMGSGLPFGIGSSDSETELYSGVDTGGVTGYSDGMIARCTNYGKVGYEHTGYNIGGIAGRQAGVVSLCTNNGTVYGRKDVGGIVGQMEPFIEIDEAESLRNAVNKLHDLIDKTIDDLQAGKDVIKTDFDHLTTFGDGALESGDALVDEMSDFVDENIDQTQVIVERMEHVMDQLPDILNNVSDAGDAFSRFNDVVKQLSEDLDIAGKLDGGTYNETDYNRITLLSTVGGTLECNSSNPSEGETVTITVVPDNGYALKDGVKAVDANNKAISVSSAGNNKYTLKMPKENVKVMASFTHIGTFLVKSNAGGRVEVTEGEDGTTTFEAKKASGYSFVRFVVAGKPMQDGQAVISLKKADYMKGSKDVIVEAVFAEQESVHKITLSQTTGGMVTAESTTAGTGETVRLRVITNSDYKLQKLRITDNLPYEPSKDTAGEYTFTMPNKDIEVEAWFEYTRKNDTDAVVYAESNIGGTISVRRSTESDVYNVTIRPSADYELKEGDCLIIENSTASSSKEEKKTEKNKKAEIDKTGNAESEKAGSTKAETEKAGITKAETDKTGNAEIAKIKTVSEKAVNTKGEAGKAANINAEASKTIGKTLKKASASAPQTNVAAISQENGNNPQVYGVGFHALAEESQRADENAESGNKPESSSQSEGSNPSKSSGKPKESVQPESSDNAEVSSSQPQSSSQPEENESDQPESSKAEGNESDQPESSSQPESNSKAEGNESDQPESSSKAEGNESDQPESNSKAEGNESDQPESSKPEGSDQPESSKPENSDQPEGSTGKEEESSESSSSNENSSDNTDESTTQPTTDKTSETTTETSTEDTTENPTQKPSDSNEKDGTETRIVLTKADLTEDSDGNYKYVLRLDRFTDARPISVMGYFQKKESSGTTYSISTASGVGGTVAADTSSAAKGDKVYVTPVSSSGYLLRTLTVKASDGSEVNCTKDSDGKRYFFYMPALDVKVTAVYEPIQIVLSSNYSGDAEYSGGADGIVTLKIRPDASYTLKGNPSVTDANGKKLSLSKKQGGSYIYEFCINNATVPCKVTITFQKQNAGGTVDTAKLDIEDSVEELQKASDNVNQCIDKIRDIVLNSDGSIKSWDQLTKDQQNEVIGEIMNLAEYLGDMSDAASSILSNLSVIAKVLSPYISDAAEAAKEDIKKGTEHIQSVLDSLKSAGNGVKGIVNYINAQPDIQFTKLGNDFDVKKEDLHNQLQGISDSLKSLSDNASNYSDIINEDLRAVNDQLNVVFNLLADHLVDYSELSVEELYEEVSDEEIDTITTGRTDSCTNKGIVKGDINVGGIAGAMSIDEEDPEDSAAGSVEYKIGRRFITKCIINGSVNEGYITAKKNGAGGIVGYMKHGVVLDSEGYGSVESTEGDYVGGICGESLTIIKRCYALCSVSGGKNIGGIAGFADTLKDCYAIVDCEATIGRKGAIAGQTASYENLPDDKEEQEIKVSGNYYVGDSLYGIDNISYVGIAEPITYEELLTAEKLPTEFWHLKVIYRIEDTYLGMQEIPFGESLASLQYPEIPERQGYYGVWPDYADKTMTGNLVVEGEYKENVTVVESAEKFLESTKGEYEKPYALVEQIFTEDTILNVTLSDRTPPVQADNKEYVIYDIALENGGISESDTFAVRIYNPYQDAEVWAYHDNQWTALESKPRGQYLQVEMTGEKEAFCIIEKKSYKLMYIIAAAACGVVLILLISFLKKLRTHRRQRRAEKKRQKEEK